MIRTVPLLHLSPADQTCPRIDGTDLVLDLSPKIGDGSDQTRTVPVLPEPTLVRL